MPRSRLTKHSGPTSRRHSDALMLPAAMLFAAVHVVKMWIHLLQVGTTTWYEIFRRRLTPELKTLPRCFSTSCPDSSAGAIRGDYPLSTPQKMAREAAGLCDRRRFLSFTFVRNPWDRLASAYLSKIARKVKDPQAQCPGKRPSFPQPRCFRPAITSAWEAPIAVRLAIMHTHTRRLNAPQKAAERGRVEPYVWSAPSLGHACVGARRANANPTTLRSRARWRDLLRPVHPLGCAAE